MKSARCCPHSEHTLDFRDSKAFSVQHEEKTQDTKYIQSLLGRSGGVGALLATSIFPDTFFYFRGLFGD